MRDLVPGNGCGLGPDRILGHGGVVGVQVIEHGLRLEQVRRERLPSDLADVVQHAAGPQHDGEVLELDLGALLEAHPACLEPAEGADGDQPDPGDLVVEGVLRPCQVVVRVGHERPVGEREAGAGDDP